MSTCFFSALMSRSLLRVMGNSNLTCLINIVGRFLFFLASKFSQSALEFDLQNSSWRKTMPVVNSAFAYEPFVDLALKASNRCKPVRVKSKIIQYNCTFPACIQGTVRLVCLVFTLRCSLLSLMCDRSRF